MNNHLIITENFKNGSVFQNSIILCFGKIENKTSNCVPCPYLQINLHTLGRPLRVSINPKTNRFQCIVELQPGYNTIVFNYCCISTSISVEFKERISNLLVVPLYIVCSDHTGKFQAPDHENNSIESACKRITLGCKILQAIFSFKLNFHKTFVINKNGCVVFRSRLHMEQMYKMNQLELWQYFAREIMQSNIATVRSKYLAFLSCTKYNGGHVVSNTHNALITQTDGYVAYGGEALALLGTACLYTWPESVFEVDNRFKDETLVDITKFVDDSYYRGTLGGCFATSLGAALHELCHTFDLGHDTEGIMGHGFNNIQQFFLSDYTTNYTNAVDAFWTRNQLAMLNYHRWFNDYPEDNMHYILQYDPATKIVKSTVGIRVVELRLDPDEQVITYWIFDSKILKYSYQINYELNNRGSNIKVVIEDNHGHILKCLLM